MVDVASLLKPVADDRPCGDDLEYDAAFAELMRGAQGKPEQQMGDAIVPAEDPDWLAVCQQATALLGRTKDLRVACCLATALLHRDGFAGFQAGLQVLRGLLERYWETLHPQLDPDDGHDPTMRVNILTSLGDTATVVAALRATPLVRARGLGDFTLRDIAIAMGEQERPAGESGPPPTLATIEAAFEACDIDALRTIEAATTGVHDELLGIEKQLMTRLGPAETPSLGNLKATTSTAAKLVAQKLARRVPSSDDAPAQATEAAAHEVSTDAMVTDNKPPTNDGNITCRDDVLRALGKICEYYERHEPSSPIPILLHRAERLVPMGFLELVRNIAPGGSAQVEALQGPNDRKA